MKIVLTFLLVFTCNLCRGDSPEVAIPADKAALIKVADLVEISGTNDLGGAENFSIHNAKALSQFLQLLTSERYLAVPKNFTPHFKSLSSYTVRFSAKGAPLLEMRIIGDSVLDMPKEPMFYLESDRHSDNLMAPLLRLR